MKFKHIACEYEILIERQYIKCKVIRGSKESRIYLLGKQLRVR